MKYYYLLIFFSLFLFQSCGDQTEKPGAGSSVKSKDPLTNPVAVQGEAIDGAISKSRTIGAEASLSSVRTAIQSFRVTNDRFPSNLEEIRPLLSSRDIDLSMYNYSSSDGGVSLK